MDHEATRARRAHSARGGDLDPGLSARIANMGFLCACLVMAIHLPVRPSAGLFSHWVVAYLQCGLGRIAVPFFFLVSGCFLTRHAFGEGWWATENKKRLRTLLVPYLVWTGIYAFLSISLVALTNHRLGAPLLENLPPVREMLLKMAGLVLDDFPFLVAFWYLRDLLLLCLVSPVIVFLTRRSRGSAILWMVFVALLYVAVLCSGYYQLIGNRPVADFFRKFFSAEGLFYFSAGVSVAKWPMTFPLGKRRALLGFLLATGLFLLTLWAKQEKLFWYPYPRLVAIPLALLSVFRLVPPVPWRPLLLSSTFALYCVHPVVITLLQSFAMIPLSKDGGGGRALGFLFAWGLVVLLSLAGVALFRKIAPGWARVAFGGR